MAQYRNDSEYGYNGALPGRIIETHDNEYGEILLGRGFTKLPENPEKNSENPEPKRQKIKKIV